MALQHEVSLRCPGGMAAGGGGGRDHVDKADIKQSDKRRLRASCPINAAQHYSSSTADCQVDARLLRTIIHTSAFLSPAQTCGIPAFYELSNFAERKPLKVDIVLHARARAEITFHSG